MNLSQVSISKINGIGKKYQELYKKIGIVSIEDLFNHFPFRYDNLIEFGSNEFNEPTRVIARGLVVSRGNNVIGRVNFFSFLLETEDSQVNVYVFNRNFLRNTLRPGQEVCVIGKFDSEKHTISCEEIIHSNFDDIDSFIPVYHSTEGLSSKIIRKNIKQGFIQFGNDVEENFPSYLIEKYRLCSRVDMFKLLHFSKTFKLANVGLRRAKYEELLLFMLKINALKSDSKVSSNGYQKKFDNKLVESFIDTLPFSLTKSQLNVIGDIKSDLESDLKMKRLLQGDVGSGKTVVAAVAILMNFLAGFQSSLMAPTEILAMQHYLSMKKFFVNYDIKIEILTGSIKNKKGIYEKLTNKEIDLVVGTHALFQDQVNYANLGLVITDEQHRFGVKQREKLNNKSDYIDTLYLSATPIPRTLALTVFGDLKVSELKTMPKGRVEIETKVLSNDQIKTVLKEIYETVKRGEQVYVVAPLIEESEKVGGVDVHSLYKKLTIAFKDKVKMDLIHGGLSPEVKTDVMKKFINKQTDLLVSTTVIEVGVDNPNATLIVIFDAYKFGLAQLHQLRGRVGRGDLVSKCLLVSSHETERLSIMTKTTDGFLLSEEDLKLRGPGNFFGKEQSGILAFKVANLVEDEKILTCAIEDSEELINKEDFDNNMEYNYFKNAVNDIKLVGLN